MKATKKSSRASSNGRRKSAAVVPNHTEQSRRQERTINFLTQDELRRLFKVMRSKRDRAIFLVAYRHGLRASEIGLLQRADVDAKQGRISIHRLKGSISGMYPMQPDVLKAIRSYLRTRADESPYLLSVTVLSRVKRHTSIVQWACISACLYRGALAPGRHGTASSHGDHCCGSS